MRVLQQDFKNQSLSSPSTYVSILYTFTIKLTKYIYNADALKELGKHTESLDYLARAVKSLKLSKNNNSNNNNANDNDRNDDKNNNTDKGVVEILRDTLSAEEATRLLVCYVLLFPSSILPYSSYKVQCYSNQALLYFHLHKVDEALQALHSATRISPGITLSFVCNLQLTSFL